MLENDIEKLKEFIETKVKLNGKIIPSRFHESWFKNNGYIKEYLQILKLTSYLKEYESYVKMDNLIYIRLKDILNDHLYPHICLCGKLLTYDIKNID